MFGAIEIIQGLTGLFIFYFCLKIIFKISNSFNNQNHKKVHQHKHDVTDYQTDDDRNDDGFGTFNNESGGYDHFDQDDSE